jgi:hypothetical protein
MDRASVRTRPGRSLDPFALSSRYFPPASSVSHPWHVLVAVMEGSTWIALWDEHRCTWIALWDERVE